MQLFHTTDIKDGFATLNEEETRHCVKVLRKRLGDRVRFIDGHGGWYEGEVAEINKRACRLRVLSKEMRPKHWDFHLHIALAPTKNITRTEWFLEKCVEIGVDEITLLHCEHSERKTVRIDRLERVVLSAAKQSLKAWLPRLRDMTPFGEFMESLARNPASKYICWVDGENRHFLRLAAKGADLLILIGPEGDFSPSEIQLALDSGFQAVGLGESRLRTETAGIVACQLAHVLNLP